MYSINFGLLSRLTRLYLSLFLRLGHLCFPLLTVLLLHRLFAFLKAGDESA